GRGRGASGQPSANCRLCSTNCTSPCLAPLAHPACYGGQKMLELDDVSHVYANGTRALDHVTLSVPRGMFGLLGPNGAGKSTLMRNVATLQSPTEGSIRFGEIDVIAQPELLRRTLGYLPQDFGVYPRVS